MKLFPPLFAVAAALLLFVTASRVQAIQIGFALDPNSSLSMAADFSGVSLVEQGYGTLGGAVLGDGDGNYDASVLVDDLNLWQGGFGSNLATVATVGAVPEPSSLVLLGLAAIVASVVGRNHRPT
jgi:hypothetical protein